MREKRIENNLKGCLHADRINLNPKDFSFSKSNKGCRISALFSPPSTTSDHPTTDPTTTKLGQSLALSSYRTLISGHHHVVTVTWCKTLLALGLHISISTTTSSSSCKVDMRPWHFWRRHGAKHFLVDDVHPVHVYWDLKNAKFSDDPEPLSDYYVALVSDHQIVLLLGDQKLDAFRRTGSGPSVFDPVLVSKKEHVFGKKRFITRAKLDVRSKKTHEICVEYCCSSSTGSLDCEMGIKIDGGEMMRVKRLQWKFRGHESVTVSSKVKVEVYWDVHDWLFSSCNNGLRHALFIFKPVAAETEPSAAPCDPSAPSTLPSTEDPSEFCLFLYAWKVE